MIVFDLQCGHGHVFEAWFRSSEAFEAQRADGLVACPVCGGTDVAKAVMAPAVGAKGNQAPPVPRPAADTRTLAALPGRARAALGEAMAKLARAQADAIAQSRWVGDRFADEARAMHYGEREHAAIHGTASLTEAKAMAEEGLPVAPLLIPVAPPDQVN